MAFMSPLEIVAGLGLTPGMTVADFGAGAGAYALALAQTVRPGGRVYAVDVQKALLARLEQEAADQKITNLVFTWGDLGTVGGSTLPDQSCDLVLMSNLLFQLPGVYPTALEAKRILKPSGRLAVIDWTDSYGGLGPPPDRIITAAAAEKIFAEAGFVVAGHLPAGDHHWGLLFKLSS